MEIGARELWTVVHGLVLGTLFLLAFAGGFAGFYSLRPEWVAVVGIRERLRRLLAGSWVMALVAWLTVTTGTWIVYPWYRAPGPDSPRSYLLAAPSRAEWHRFGMEWKEHIAFITAGVAGVFGAFINKVSPIR